MTKTTVVVIGGGFAGCGAALAAAKAGASVVLLERTDLLLAGGLGAGRMNYNGKIVIAEEAKALGAGEIFEALESIILHRGSIGEEFHGYVYNTPIVEATIRRLLAEKGINMRFQSRASRVQTDRGHVVSVITDAGQTIEGDAFVDCTGTTGGMAVCRKYGKGCVLCSWYRCPTYGDRVSPAVKAGAREFHRRKSDGSIGAIVAAIMLMKSSLSDGLRQELEGKGAVVIPLPAKFIDYSKRQDISSMGPRQQMESLNLVDIGVGAKCVRIGYLSLEQLRSIPGLENVMVQDPLSGGAFNAMKGVSMLQRDDALLVVGFDNLLCGGEKTGPGGGIAECLALGLVAGHNAARIGRRKKPLALPGTICLGDFIRYTGQMLTTPGGLDFNYHAGHGHYFERMKELGLYTTDIDRIHRKVKEAGLSGALAEKLV